MIALPPLEVGAVQDTTEYRERYEEAVTPVGAPGTVGAATGVDAMPAPMALLAVTVTEIFTASAGLSGKNSQEVAVTPTHSISVGAPFQRRVTV